MKVYSCKLIGKGSISVLIFGRGIGSLSIKSVQACVLEYTDKNSSGVVPAVSVISVIRYYVIT